MYIFYIFTLRQHILLNKLLLPFKVPKPKTSGQMGLFCDDITCVHHKLELDLSSLKNTEKK